MANALYDKGRQRFLRASLTGTPTSSRLYWWTPVRTHLTCPLMNSWLTLVRVASIAASAAFSGKTTLGGAADANDVTFSSVSGASIEAIVLYKDTGTEATSPLIAYIDTATGLPITPNGGDIIVTWDNGPNKIFAVISENYV